MARYTWTQSVSFQYGMFDANSRYTLRATIVLPGGSGTCTALSPYAGLVLLGFNDVPYVQVISVPNLVGRSFSAPIDVEFVYERLPGYPTSGTLWHYPWADFNVPEPPPPSHRTLNVGAPFGPSPQGGTTVPVPGSYPYALGAAVTITANPSSGYKFDHWFIDGWETQPRCFLNPVTLIMDQDHTIAPYFVPTAPPPPQTIQAKFFTLPAGRGGQRPSDFAAEDLHGTITVDGSSYATPVTIQLTIGATVNLSAPGAVDWDYYGVGHVHSPEASYVVVATATEFAAFYEAAPPPPPPPPTSPIGVLVAVAGATLLLVLGVVAYQRLS